MGCWFLLALLASSAAAQPTSNDVFRAGTDLVVVPVTVTGPKTAFVDGLGGSDFRLSDNGRAQSIRVETSDVVSVPISIAVVIQTNDLARPALAKISKVGSMIQPLITGENGRAAIVRFGSQIELVQEFTSDASLIGDAFARLAIYPDSTARMRDAVDAAARMLEARPPSERKAILLISETRDRGSETTLAELAQSLQRSSITVFAATFSVYATAFTSKQHEQTAASGMNLIAAFRELGRLGKLNDVEALTEATGGDRSSFATLRSLETRVSRLGEELHAQYQLTYQPDTKDAGYHRIAIQIPAQPKLAVRARPGYWNGLRAE